MRTITRPIILAGYALLFLTSSLLGNNSVAVQQKLAERSRITAEITTENIGRIIAGLRSNRQKIGQKEFLEYDLGNDLTMIALRLRGSGKINAARAIAQRAIEVLDKAKADLEPDTEHEGRISQIVKMQNILKQSVLRETNEPED